MNGNDLHQLLQSVADGSLPPDQALARLQGLVDSPLDCAFLDHRRELRLGQPEVVFAEHKSMKQLQVILSVMLTRDSVVLATRVAADKAEALCRKLPDLRYHPCSRMLTGNREHIRQEAGLGEITIITAGTSDLPVAEETQLCLEYFGHPVRVLADAGVAGIHRLFAHLETLRQASVVIVVAGMEGALPSVVAGLIPAPVIGVPTSVGYGTGAGGFAALLGMLNSCAPGLAVVNIDNGFGAACMAAAINRKR